MLSDFNYQATRSPILLMARPAQELRSAGHDIVDLTFTEPDCSAAENGLKAGVTALPVSAFGMPGRLRLSFATDQTTLVKGCRPLLAALGGPQ